MIDFKKIVLYFALAAVAYLLWMSWQKDYPNGMKHPTEQGTSKKAVSRKNLLPSVSPTSQSISSKPSSDLPQVNFHSKSKLIQIKRCLSKLDTFHQHPI